MISDGTFVRKKLKAKTADVGEDSEEVKKREVS